MVIVKTEVHLPKESDRQEGKLAFILDNVLTEEECDKLIKGF